LEALGAKIGRENDEICRFLALFSETFSGPKTFQWGRPNKIFKSVSETFSGVEKAALIIIIYKYIYILIMMILYNQTYKIFIILKQINMIGEQKKGRKENPNVESDTHIKKKKKKIKALSHE
jgi:cell division protein FtsL